MEKNRKNELRGTLLGIAAAILGGICPIYWRQLRDISSIVILFYRVVLVCACTFLLCLAIYKWDGLIKPLREKGAIGHFLLTGVVMVTNWGLYVWAVNAGYIVQTSIGYFMVPLFVCLIGMLVYHEPVDRYKIIALITVFVGTVVLVIAYGEFPTVAFAVSISYSVYTSAQKKAHVSGILAMFYQTLFVLPVFLAAVIYVELTGQGALASASGQQLFLLSFAGIVTALPLILLLDGINCASLILMGLTNYLGDTISLLIGVFVYGEELTRSQLGGLLIIWAGIVIYTAGTGKRTDGRESET